MRFGVPRKRFLVAGAIGLAIFFYTIKQADLQRLLESVEHIHPFWAFLALAASAGSYLCIGGVLHRLLTSMGHDFPFSASFRIALVSCTMNYLMAIGGLSGVAAKVYLLAREKVPPSSTLSISMVHGFLTNTVAVILVYLGFFFLYSEYKMSARELEAGIVVLALAFLLSWLTIQIIVHESFRKKLWQLLMRLGRFLCRKLHHPHWFREERAQSFFENFNDSLNLIMRNSTILLRPAVYALFDWLLMFLCLKFSFLAVQYSVDNTTLLVGFSVGIFLNLFSLTPASIGLMEGSMAACFYLMGLDYERALLATLIYRLAYYFLPILVSLFYYKQLLASPSPNGNVAGAPAQPFPQDYQTDSNGKTASVASGRN